MIISKGSRSLIKVDRALSELRRGGTIILRLNNYESCLLRSLEMMFDGDAIEMGKHCRSTPMLVITKTRAAAMGKKLNKSCCCATVPAVKHSVPDLMNMAIGWPETGAIDHQISIVGEKANSLADYATRLFRRAKLAPAAIICRLPTRVKMEQDRLAAESDMLVLEEREVTQYYRNRGENFRIVTRAKVPLAVDPNAEVVVFREESREEEHFTVLVGGEVPSGAPLVRIHSQCLTGDVLGSLKCDCGEQLQAALKMMAENGGGILVYLAQEGRDIGFLNKMRAYGLQDSGLDTVDANHVLGFEADERHFAPAVKILNALGVFEIKLLTNNPEKIAHFGDTSIKVIERIPLIVKPNEYNKNYIETKKLRAGHLS